jgi:tight adherence protein C
MSVELVITFAALFVSVLLLAMLALSLVAWRFSPERRGLARARAATAVAAGQTGTTALTIPEGDLPARLVSVAPKAPRDVFWLRRQLIRAGYHGSRPVVMYTIAQVVTPVVLGLLPLAFLPLARAWPFMLAGVVAGLLLPRYVLARRVARRHRIIRNGLPDALDLLIVCLESGSSLDQAIVRVSDELELVYPELADELRLLVAETRAGKPRLDAFRNLAERTGVSDVRALVAMLVQTDRFGTSAAQALRAHAFASRTRRRQRAEEQAAKIGVKLAFPLVLCLFPAFFIVTLGPAVVQFARIFFGQVAPQ